MTPGRREARLPFVHLFNLPSCSLLKAWYSGTCERSDCGELAKMSPEIVDTEVGFSR